MSGKNSTECTKLLFSIHFFHSAGWFKQKKTRRECMNSKCIQECWFLAHFLLYFCFFLCAADDKI